MLFCRVCFSNSQRAVSVTEQKERVHWALATRGAGTRGEKRAYFVMKAPPRRTSGSDARRPRPPTACQSQTAQGKVTGHPRGPGLSWGPIGEVRVINSFPGP